MSNENYPPVVIEQKELKNGDNDTKIKFIQGNDDSKLDEKAREGFTGLTKEELMEYANDPFWVRLRWFLFILFWLVWIAMLVAAIVLIIRAPRCPKKAVQTWAHDSALYQLYPKSFKDNNGDGVGDLNGISSKIDYLSGKSIKNVLLYSPFNTNPDYEDEAVVNFTRINPKLGTNEEFQDLITKLHNNGMKVIVELDIHHTYTTHPWFQKSLQNNTRHRDFYVWADGIGNNPPSNDKSLWTGPAWNYSPDRRQYYLSDYSLNHPNLNLANSVVQSEIKDVIDFWSQKGVDGFYLPNADIWFRSIPSSYFNNSSPTGNLTLSQFKTVELINYLKKAAPNKVFLVSAYDDNSHVPLLASNADLVSNKALTKIDANCDSTCIKNIVSSQIKNPQREAIMLGDKDISRIATRLSRGAGSPTPPNTYLTALNALMLLLPGTCMPYYGDEIGIHDNPLTIPNANQPSLAPVPNPPTTYDMLCKMAFMGKCRDSYRSPMQWTSGPNAGFSNFSGPLWLPPNADYVQNNVQDAKYLPAFSKFLELKQKEPFSSSSVSSNFEMLDGNPSILAFTRSNKADKYLVLINFGKNPATFLNRNSKGDTLASKAQLVVNSFEKSTLEPSTDSKTIKVGEESPFGDQLMAPGQVLIYKLK